jgi:hypothetical protein
LENFLVGLAPDEMFLGLAIPKTLWAIDRLGIESLISRITPKVCLALKLGRRPENPNFSGY